MTESSETQLHAVGVLTKAEAAYQDVLPSISQMGLLAPGVGWAANGLDFYVTRNGALGWRNVQVPGLGGDIVANLMASASPGTNDLVLAFYGGKVYGSCAHPTGQASGRSLRPRPGRGRAAPRHRQPRGSPRRCPPRCRVPRR